MSLPQHHPINVLVQHAEPLLTVGLVSTLRRIDGVRVHAPAIEPAEASLPSIDVAVTDHAGGIKMTSDQRMGLAGSLARARVLIIATQVRENDVRVALEQGVHGYLLLGCPLQELAMGVDALSRGRRYLGAEVAQRMADSLTREALTAREFDVLRLLAHGACNKTIARRLDIAIGTVKTHVKSIMSKLEAGSRTQAVTIASHRGLVDAGATALEG